MNSIGRMAGALRALRCGCVGVGLVALAACGLFMSDDALLKRAKEAQQKGDLRAASIDLKNLLEKKPNNAEARFVLGIVDLESGDVVAATREFERARTDGIAASRVVEPLVRSYQAQRQFDKALQVLDAEIAKAKASNAKLEDRARFVRMRGEVLFGKREYAESRAAFESVLAESPNDVKALLGLAGVLEATEGSEASLKATDRALAANPNDTSVHLARGALFLQMKKPSDAAAAFQKASELATAPNQKSELLSALGGLAQAQLAQGQVESALQITQRMQEMAPKSSTTRFVRAYALAQNGELDKARELLEQNVAQVDDLRSRLLLGAVNLTQGRYSQAEMQLSAVVAAAPNNVEARQLLAESRMRQSKPADALDTLLPAIEGGGNPNANMLALAGQASLAAGRTKEGVALLKRNAEQHPNDARTQLDLAAGYLAAGQADQALIVLNSSSGAKASGNAPVSAQQAEIDLLRREYLSVLARLQKNDAAGAVSHATKAAQEQPKNAALQSLAASVLMTQRQFDKARPYAEAAIQLRPNVSAGYSNLGRLDLLQGKVEAAREDFRNALSKQPEDPVAAASLALLEISAGRNEAALAVLGDFRKHNQKSIEPRLVEAQLLLSLGRLDEAEKVSRDALSLAENNPSALAALGRILTTQGRHSEALSTFERAVRVEPKSAPLRHQLAVAQRAAGKGDEALQTTREVLKLDEHFGPALQMDGLLSIYKGDLNTATRRADELLKTAADQPATYELVGALRYAQQRYADSVAAYQKAGELNPRPQYAIAEFEARRQGKLENPEGALEKYLAKNPNEPTARVSLAQAQQGRGDRAGAARSYETVLSNQPKNVIALNNLAWMRYEDGKSDAVDLARRAYNVAPESPAVADTYAWILVNTGKVADGLKLFEGLFDKSSRKSPPVTAPEIRAHYAVTLSKAGRRAEAKALARDLTGKHETELSADLRTLLADLIKS